MSYDIFTSALGSSEISFTAFASVAPIYVVQTTLSFPPLFANSFNSFRIIAIPETFTKETNISTLSEETISFFSSSKNLNSFSPENSLLLIRDVFGLSSSFVLTRSSLTSFNASPFLSISFESNSYSGKEVAS